MLIDSKQCSKCGEIKPLDYFYLYAKGHLSAGKPMAQCKECFKAEVRARRAEDGEHVRGLQRTRYWKNPQYFRDERNKARKNNLEHERAVDRQWRLRNLKKVAATKAETQRRRKKKDPYFRAVMNLRRRLLFVLTGPKSSTFENLLGCTIDQFLGHLEINFQEGMTWENYGRGGWHIDHIKPCASFDLNKPEQQRECFHWKNLQSLWEKDNLAKGAKILNA